MMRRLIAAGVALCLAATILMLAPGSALGLSCPVDEDDLKFEQMIEQGTTGEDRYPIMTLGVVRSLKDMGGDPTVDGPSLGSRSWNTRSGMPL